MATNGVSHIKHDDEQAIRALVDKWLESTKVGDYETVLTLIADDAIFMVPGREPFGKEAFAAQSEQMKGAKIEGKSDIQEIEVIGDHAWLRNYLQVTITQPNGQSMMRSGYTLTVLRKDADGRWLMVRDANLVS
jgi:uncharacterized protein (TIGR02246 family)